MPIVTPVCSPVCKPLRKCTGEPVTDLDTLRSRGLWRERQELRLHLGCGETHLAGYVNVDYPTTSHSVMNVSPDYAADITKLSFPVGSVSEIRLHHVFEHLGRIDALASLIRWQQWLAIGGDLLIETPDFEASARDFLAAPSLALKLRAIRHLEGDQSDAWAYHIGQWFPERFSVTLTKLGFSEITVARETSGHTPPLLNITARATKHRAVSKAALYQEACELLAMFTVADAEAPTLAVWKLQLSQALELPAPGPGQAGSAGRGGWLRAEG
jgi:hypothetical protein